MTWLRRHNICSKMGMADVTAIRYNSMWQVRVVPPLCLWVSRQGEINIVETPRYMQAASPQQMLDQHAVLDRLHWLLADTRRLVSAVGLVEGNAAAKSHLEVCIVSVRLLLIVV